MKNFQTTEEIAKILKVKPATVRRGLCINGHYMGIRPIKMPNRRLLWPAVNVERFKDQASGNKAI